jgi:hypothetical protein
VRKSARSRRKKRPIKRVSKEIPIRTFHDSQDCGPGYLEIDFVVHGGGSMAGEYLHSLVATDVYSGDLGNGPERESLSNFLAKLPEMWKSGEVRATHRRESAKARHWRTHEDAFAGVWADLLLWLQHDPDCTAKSLLCRLEKAYPGRFQVKQLRTLQRRIGEWRKSMAKTLILEGIPEPILVETVQ